MLRDKFGYPVKFMKGQHLQNFSRVFIKTSIKATVNHYKKRLLNHEKHRNELHTTIHFSNT